MPVSWAALDAAVRRFPRILMECSLRPSDPHRALWLLADGCVPPILAEYRLILRRETACGSD